MGYLLLARRACTRAGTTVALLVPISALSQPIHLDKRVTPAAAELVLRLDAPRHILFVKRGPGNALRILWPSPRPDSLPLLESGAWVVVARPMGTGFQVVGSPSTAQCFLVSPEDPFHKSTVTWNAECGLGPAYLSGSTLAASAGGDDYVEVMAIDLGRSYPSNQLEEMVAQLSAHGSRKDFVQRLAEQLGETPRRAPWAATRVPAIRP